MDAVLQQAVDALEKFAKNDAQAHARVLKRREIWASTRKTIENAFTDIIQQSGRHERGLHVFATRKFNNFEVVQLHFGKIPTGISEENAMGIETGAALVFGQGESGKIVVHRYPFITELPSEARATNPQHIFIGTYEPEEVTREFVLNSAKEFFVWAAQTTYRTREKEDRRMGFFPPVAPV
jgi:hypothetical protein